MSLFFTSLAGPTNLVLPRETYLLAPPGLVYLYAHYSVFPSCNSNVLEKFTLQNNLKNLKFGTSGFPAVRRNTYKCCWMHKPFRSTRTHERTAFKLHKAELTYACHQYPIPIPNLYGRSEISHWLDLRAAAIFFYFRNYYVIYRVGLFKIKCR